MLPPEIDLTSELKGVGLVIKIQITERIGLDVGLELSNIFSTRDN